MQGELLLVLSFARVLLWRVPACMQMSSPVINEVSVPFSNFYLSSLAASPTL